MQFTTGLVLLAQAVGVFSSAVARDVSGECGDLGVMERVGLPVGVDQSSVRQCTNGPSGSPLTGSLTKRDCWFGSNSGCSKSGYCWARCGNEDAGTWCWTARNDGFGDWYTCSKDDDCDEDYSCGNAAGGNECKDCGCSC